MKIIKTSIASLIDLSGKLTDQSPRTRSKWIYIK